MKIYDLTATVKKGLWYYGKPYVPYKMEPLANLKKNGYITNKHVITSHTGTHVECGRHWWEDAEGVDHIPLEKFIGNARVLRFECGETPFFTIDRERLDAAGGNELQKDDICILVTGWDTRIQEENYIWESPFLTVDAARYLVEKEIKSVALDTPMLGDPRDGMDFVPADLVLPDYILLQNGIPYILGLIGAQSLPDPVFFAGAPLKLKDADGSPIRAMAIEF